MTRLDLSKLRNDFPLIGQPGQADSLIYFDNAATTQKPEAVLGSIERFYRQQNANVHRAAHRLSDIATAEFEKARECVRGFFNAQDKAEIIWTSGATESINLVANCLAFESTDEILISALEHHANIVPWQMAAQRSGAKIRVIPLLPCGDLDIPAFKKMLNAQTRLVAITQASNAIGTMPPLEQIISAAHNAGALVLVDGAQAISHQPINLQQLGCDFFVCSGHKAFAPTGIGILYGKKHLLNEMPPWQGGGEMITRVSFSESMFQPSPYRFEAGTPNISGALGFAAALRYLNGLDRSALHEHEQQLVTHARSRLEAIDGISITGHPLQQAPLISFTTPNMDHKDIGTLLDQQGIAVRVGHHCAMPLMGLLGIPGTIRASFSIYNTLTEVDTFADALEGIIDSGTSISAPDLQSPTHNKSTMCEFERYGKEISIDAICEELLTAVDWQQRYRKIMKLGTALPRLAETLKSDEYRVSGCESAVWLHCVKSDTSDRVYFMADSDSRVLRGLLGIILCCANHQSIENLINFNPQEIFNNIDLQRHLSPSRSNGLHSIIEQIRRYALELCD